MPRVLALNALLFALPFLVYAGFLYLSRGKAGDMADWTANRVVIMSLIGIVLLVGGLLYFISFEAGQPGTTYHPPVLRDGEVVPGGFD